MQKKSFWKLRKIQNSPWCQTDWNQQPSTVSYFACEPLAFVSNNPISIRYFEWVYRWKISIYNLKMEFWFQ